jgi:hypothetical protein
VIASASARRRGGPNREFQGSFDIWASRPVSGSESRSDPKYQRSRPGKNGLGQVIKDIDLLGVLVSSMNSLDHAPKVWDGEHSRKMETAIHTKSAMTKQVVASQKLEKLFPG